MSYQVGEVARISGVTIRTLHHYDQIGLLVPSERTAAGYRRYSEADLDRLHQILTYRELGFPLEEIADLLAEPRTGAIGHLRRQHELLLTRIERLTKMAEAIEFMMEAQQMGIQLTPQERFEVFGDFNPDDYAEEARERWGHTEAYQESQRRAASYTKADWQRIRAEAGGLYQRLAEAMAAGQPATSEPVMDLAEEHRQQINQWFYDCSYEIHRGLAEMYVNDQRFTDNIDRNAEGLAAYLREAILANADRAAA